MNYSKNLSKSAMARRVLMLAVITATFGLMVGGIAGYTIKAHIDTKDKPKEEMQVREQYNAITLGYDTLCFIAGNTFDWHVGDLEFKPLDCRMPQEQQEFVYYICAGYHLDFSLVMALIQVESGYEPQAVSSTNDYGLMQINQMNHEWLTEVLSVTDYLDPYQNICAGVFVLRKLYEQYQDTNIVLMVYNMGENGAERLWDKCIFETDYTQQVLTVQQQINDQLKED